MVRQTGQRRGTRGGLLLGLATALLIAAALCVAALAASAGAAGSVGGIDPAYGAGGVVSLAGTEGAGEPPTPIGVSSFGPAADGSAYVIGNRYECGAPGEGCGYSYSLARYESDGRRDEAFGGAAGGAVPLPAALRASVIADEGAALVIGFAGKGVVLRRFTAAGLPDPSFGDGGVAQFSCYCGGAAHLRALIEPDGKILVDVDRSAHPGGFFENGTEVRLTRLLPDGALDRGFGTAGTFRFTIRGPGAPQSVVAAPGDATLIGGSGFAFETACCGQRHIYVRRVTGDGRLDRRFDRNAARSLKPLEIRGRFPTLTAVVQGGGGLVSVLGYAGEHGGYDLRLRADGRPVAGFGARGVLRLPFEPEGAVGGNGGAIFAVGASDVSSGGYHAFRIMASGALDPAYHRGRGIRVPITGVRMAITALGEGRVMVTDNGNSYCRYACTAQPTMVRFLE